MCCSAISDTEGDNFRGDLPETFENRWDYFKLKHLLVRMFTSIYVLVDLFLNREAMVASVPSYEEPYIKVPKVLNKEWPTWIRYVHELKNTKIKNR